MKVIELLEDTEDMVAAIKRDCKQFLGHKLNGLLMRGMTGKGLEIVKRSVRQDRKPLSSSPEKHKAFDEWSLDKFGFRGRSQCVFVTGNYDDAASYGHPYAIFPVGDFDFLWSPDVGDLFMYNYSGRPVDFSTLGYKDAVLTDAIDSGNEVMLHCKEYYAVPITEDHTRRWILKTFFPSE